MWLSLFALGGRRHPSGRAGLVGVAWVDYADPSPLTYDELLLAVPAGWRRGPLVRVHDIWVDSPASRDGGRELWAIPKELASFTSHSGGRRTRWSMSLDGTEVASVDYRALTGAGPRAPYAFSTRQPPLEGPSDSTGADVVAPVRGRARMLPCRSRWDVAPDGPLGRLAGVRPVTSVCLQDFALSFG